jgi:hypothetical protein
MNSIMDLPRLGPYVGISHDRVVQKNTGKGRRAFRIIIYGAYDAFGLIGSECNGIAVLDDDAREVVADEIIKQPSGWSGPSHGQVQVFNSLVKANWTEFRKTVNASRRLRYAI